MSDEKKVSMTSSEITTVSNAPQNDGQSQDYKAGAKKFNHFVKRPGRYKNEEAILRVRMDGLYGGWRLRDEVFKGFGFVPGDALFLNDLYVLGLEKLDVGKEDWVVDCFASGKAADWLDENNVAQGTIFEGRFKFAYETVRKGAGSRGSLEAVDAKIANLILLEGVKVIGIGVSTIGGELIREHLPYWIGTDMGE